MSPDTDTDNPRCPTCQSDLSAVVKQARAAALREAERAASAVPVRGHTEEDEPAGQDEMRASICDKLRGMADAAKKPTRCRLHEGSDGDTHAGCMRDAGHSGKCNIRSRPDCVREDAKMGEPT